MDNFKLDHAAIYARRDAIHAAAARPQPQGGDATTPAASSAERAWTPSEVYSYRAAVYAAAMVRGL